MLILTAVLVIGSGLSLAVFMNSLWNDDMAQFANSELEPDNDNNGGFNLTSEIEDS